MGHQFSKLDVEGKEQTFGVPAVFTSSNFLRRAILSGRSSFISMLHFRWIFSTSFPGMGGRAGERRSAGLPLEGGVLDPIIEDLPRGAEGGYILLANSEMEAARSPEDVDREKIGIDPRPVRAGDVLANEAELPLNSAGLEVGSEDSGPEEPL